MKVLPEVFSDNFLIDGLNPFWRDPHVIEIYSAMSEQGMRLTAELISGFKDHLHCVGVFR